MLALTSTAPIQYCMQIMIFGRLNATTGQPMWNLPIGYAADPTVADGVRLDYSNYDGNLYALGRGVTSTTVSATPALGNDAITIQGTVTDQSPGLLPLGFQLQAHPQYPTTA